MNLNIVRKCLQGYENALLKLMGKIGKNNNVSNEVVGLCVHTSKIKMMTLFFSRVYIFWMFRNSLLWISDENISNILSSSNILENHWLHETLESLNQLFRKSKLKAAPIAEWSRPFIFSALNRSSSHRCFCFCWGFTALSTTYAMSSRSVTH